MSDPSLVKVSLFLEENLEEETYQENIVTVQGNVEERIHVYKAKKI